MKYKVTGIVYVLSAGNRLTQSKASVKMDPTRGKFEIEKFDGKGDFGLWKFKMLAQLEIQGLLSVLRDDPAESKEASKSEEDEADIKIDPKKADKDLRVRSLFSTCLSDVILRKIMHETTALGMWKALEKDYQTKSLPNRIYLKKKFSCYKMEEEKSMEENFDLFLKLIDDLASIKVSISDEDQAIQLLSSLPQAYEQLVHTLQYGTGKDTLTVSEVMTSAYSKEVELKQKSITTKGKQSEGLYTEARGRLSTRSEGGNNKPWQNKNKGRARSKSRGRPTGKADKTCWICGSDSHWKRDCPKRKQGSQSMRTNNSANLALNLPEPTVLTASLYVSAGEWVLDSGCTFHITPRRELLTDFVETNGNKVMMGNNTYCMVKGMGNITIDNSDGSVINLRDVRYMPEMGRNLISYGQLESSGYHYRGRDYKIEFFKGDKKVLTGKYSNGLYYLQGTVRKAEANTAERRTDYTKQWHSRLAHMNTRSMQTLAKKGYLNSKEIGKLEFCEGCAMGKAHRQKFPKAKHFTKEVLEYIHTDLWGSPNTVSSLSGAHYFLKKFGSTSLKLKMKCFNVSQNGRC